MRAGPVPCRSLLLSMQGTFRFRSRSASTACSSASHMFCTISRVEHSAWKGSRVLLIILTCGDLCVPCMPRLVLPIRSRKLVCRGSPAVLPWSREKRCWLCFGFLLSSCYRSASLWSLKTLMKKPQRVSVHHTFSRASWVVRMSSRVSCAP